MHTQAQLGDSRAFWNDFWESTAVIMETPDTASSRPDDWMDRMIQRTYPFKYAASDPPDEKMEAAMRYAQSSHLLGLIINMVVCSCLGIVGTLSFIWFLIRSIVFSVVPSPRFELCVGVVSLAGMSWFSIKMAKSARRLLRRMIEADEKLVLQKSRTDDDGS